MDRSNNSGGRGLVIVAIPRENDPVWKISSEKIPHLTLCYLGDQVDDDAIARMTQYLSHVVKTTMRPFGMGVKRRGVLGENQADALFFHEDHADELRDIRSYLLANSDIYNAYHSTEQYAKWLPHLTLGYPETPAKPDNREYPGIDWVSFDRIALWTGDYEGAEFELSYSDRDEVSMSDEGDELVQSDLFVEDFLQHYGVKGMKWGVIRDKVASTFSNKSVREEARERFRDSRNRAKYDHKDKASVREFRQRADKQGVRTLGDKELSQLVKRAELENKYRELRKKEKEASRAFLKAMWDGFGKELLGAVIREGVAYKFRGGNSGGGGSSRATVIDGRIIEGATRMLSRRPERP